MSDVDFEGAVTFDPAQLIDAFPRLSDNHVRTFQTFVERGKPRHALAVVAFWGHHTATRVERLDDTETLCVPSQQPGQPDLIYCDEQGIYLLQRLVEYRGQHHYKGGHGCPLGTAFADCE